MSDTEDYSGLLESKIECISRRVAKEEITAISDAVGDIQKNLADIQRAAITLLVTILLAVLSYLGVKTIDRTFDAENKTVKTEVNTK